MSTTPAHGDKLSAVCKFWNIEKGYGFLELEGGENVFCHNSDLSVANEAYRALVPDVKVQFTYNTEGEKPKAENVTSETGEQLEGFPSKMLASAGISMALRKRKDPNLQTGKVKFFDGAKGFGFIIPEGGGEDIYVRLSNLMEGPPLQTDDPVEYTVQPGQGGKKAEALKVSNRRVGGGPLAGGMPTVPGLHMPGRPQPRLGMGFPPMGAPRVAPRAVLPMMASGRGPAGPPANGRGTGNVKFFNAEKGFGFIVPTLGGADLHFSQSNVNGGITLGQGDYVEYTVQTRGEKSWAAEVGKAVPRSNPPTARYQGFPERSAYPEPPRYPERFPEPAFDRGFDGGYGGERAPAYAAPQALPMAPSDPFSRRQAGVVKFFSAEKEFGFIIPNAGGKDVHFSRKSIQGASSFAQGDHVEYDFQSKDGNTWAANVSPAAPPSASFQGLGKRKPDYAPQGQHGYSPYGEDKMQKLAPEPAYVPPSYTQYTPTPGYDAYAAQGNPNPYYR